MSLRTCIPAAMQNSFVWHTMLASSSCGCNAGEMGPFGMAEVALRFLHSLVALQPATGEAGRLLHPLPLVHRLLAGPTCLPHLAQVNYFLGLGLV